jgi:hypothetical protein
LRCARILKALFAKVAAASKDHVIAVADLEGKKQK